MQSGTQSTKNDGQKIYLLMLKEKKIKQLLQSTLHPHD